MKLTKWYPAHVKPVRAGYYHTMEGESTDKESQFNWYWDGMSWCAYPWSGPSAFQNRMWRGIAK